MKARPVLLLIIVFNLISSAVIAQEFNCSISHRSEFRKNVYLGDHGFRIRKQGQDLFELQRRLADGSWGLSYGYYSYEDYGFNYEDGFHAYILLPNQQSAGSYVSMITVHKQSGNIAIFIHNGSYTGEGGYQRAAVLQGNCSLS